MPAALIQCSRLSKSFGPHPLFEEISLSIHPGELFALVGENGAGKTTLLQLLQGEIFPDSGSIHRASHLSTGYLPQEVKPQHPEETARTFLEAGVLATLEEQMATCLQDLKRLHEWAELHERYEHLGGYRRPPLEKILEGLRLERKLLDLPMGQLSSGQRVQMALAKALLESPDLLLLDEPTNHLDQEGALLPLSQTPLQFFQLEEKELRSKLHMAGLGSSALLNRPFACLSVGQRKRLQLLSLILKKPNILLLDEPTNHLDLTTLEALEDALLHFQGAILAISHDRTFTRKIATQEWPIPP